MSGRSAPIRAGVDPEAAIHRARRLAACGRFRFDGKAEA